MGEGLRIFKKQDFQKCDKNKKLQTKERPTIYTTSNSRKKSENKRGLKKNLVKDFKKKKRANKDLTIYKSSNFRKKT